MALSDYVAPVRNDVSQQSWNDMATARGTIGKTNAENLKAQTDADQALLARKLFAKHISKGDTVDTKGNVVPAGQLNESGYIADAASNGLSEEAIKAPLGYKAAQQASDVNTAIVNTQLTSAGYKPDAAPRNQASTGAPEPVSMPNPAYQDPSVPTPTTTSSKLTEWFKPTPKPVGDEIGVTTITPGGMQPLPEGAGASPTILQPGQDTRSARQVVEDSYDPSQTIEARTAGGTDATTDDDSLFQWDPQDNGTNQFQQFKSALTAKLKGIGAVDPEGNPDPSKYLRQLYTAKVLENMPPKPNEMLLQQGREGMVKYRAEQQVYQAALDKAMGLGQQAVLKAKNDMADWAKQYGIDTVEQRKSEIPGGILRDPARRQEAAALITNEQNIANAEHALKAAVDPNTGAPNMAKLLMVAPQSIRAYATALNPGQQLNEGGLLEVGQILFPHANKPQWEQIALGLGRGLKNNDWSLFDTIAGTIDATSPQALYARLELLNKEAATLNATSKASYVQPAPGAQPTAPAAPTPKTLGDIVGVKPKEPVKPRKPAAPAAPVKLTKSGHPVKTF